VNKLAPLALASALGCMGHSEVARVDPSHQAKFGLVSIDQLSSYLVDPRTETCALLRAVGASTAVAIPVSCAKLKRSVPEAARLITWDTAEPAAAPAPAGH
jgi:hypothetical protein